MALVRINLARRTSAPCLRISPRLPTLLSCLFKGHTPERVAQIEIENPAEKLLAGQAATDDKIIARSELFYGPPANHISTVWSTAPQPPIGPGAGAAWLSAYRLAWGLRSWSPPY